MVTLALLSTLLLQVATPGEMSCLGFIQDAPAPLNIYVSGTEEDEVNNYSHVGQLLYLDGPAASSLKPGELYRVVRPDGRIRDKITGATVGIYHMELGTVRIEAVRRDGASASVIHSCHVILKGDILLPTVARQPARFDGKLSDRLTPFSDDGTMSSIILGKNGIREMGAGDFCFIALGRRDGIKVGDRFTVFRPQPPFNSHDLDLAGSKGGAAYEQYSSHKYRGVLSGLLKNRKAPPRMLGDLVVLDVQEGAAVTKIINSLAEINIGDIVIRR